MRRKLFVILILLVLLLVGTACGGTTESAGAEPPENEQVVDHKDAHMDEGMNEVMAEHMDEHDDDHMDESIDEDMHEHDAEHMDEHDAEHMDEGMHEGMNEDMAEGMHEDMHEHMNEDGMHMHMNPPDEFATLVNPFAGDSAAIDAGKEIFEVNCTRCHGPEGHGDGPDAVGLDPRPANLANTAMISELSDGYLFWRVSKGGAFEPFNSAMINWEQTLSEEQRWQVISFVRTLNSE